MSSLLWVVYFMYMCMYVARMFCVCLCMRVCVSVCVCLCVCVCVRVCVCVIMWVTMCVCVTRWAKAAVFMQLFYCLTSFMKYSTTIYMSNVSIGNVNWSAFWRTFTNPVASWLSQERIRTNRVVGTWNCSHHYLNVTGLVYVSWCWTPL